MVDKIIAALAILSGLFTTLYSVYQTSSQNIEIKYIEQQYNEKTTYLQHAFNQCKSMEDIFYNEIKNRETFVILVSKINNYETRGTRKPSQDELEKYLEYSVKLTEDIERIRVFLSHEENEKFEKLDKYIKESYPDEEYDKLTTIRSYAITRIIEQKIRVCNTTGFSYMSKHDI